MCDQRLFAPQLAALSTHYRVIVADITGSDSIESLAKSVFAEIDKQMGHVDAPSSFNLLGFSMGAIVAMAMVDMRPHLVKRLALLNANFRADTEQRKVERLEQIRVVQSNHLRQVVAENLKPFYLAPGNRNDQELLTTLMAMALSLGDKIFVSQSTVLLHRKEQSSVLRNVVCPTLILCGEQDRLCPPAQHREMHSMVNPSELVVVPGTGHISTLESPDQVNQAIIGWLQR